MEYNILLYLQSLQVHYKKTHDFKFCICEWEVGVISELPNQHFRNKHSQNKLLFSSIILLSGAHVLEYSIP